MADRRLDGVALAQEPTDRLGLGRRLRRSPVARCASGSSLAWAAALVLRAPGSFPSGRALCRTPGRLPTVTGELLALKDAVGVPDLPSCFALHAVSFHPHSNLQVLFLLMFSQVLNDLANLLGLVGLADQQHIPGVDDHRIVHADGHDQSVAAVPIDQRVVSLKRQVLCAVDDTLPRMSGSSTSNKGVPRSHVAPAHSACWHHHNVLRVLHHAVVNRFSLERRPGRLDRGVLARRTPGAGHTIQRAGRAPACAVGSP